MDEFKYRLKDIWYRLFYNGSKARRIISRLFALTLISIFATLVAPTLAEELAGGNSESELQATPAASAEPTASDSSTVETTVETETTTSGVAPSPTINPSLTSTPAASDEPIEQGPSDSETVASEPPPGPLANQPKYILRFPASLSVDPRAKTFFLPQVLASPSAPVPSTLVCITGRGVALDLKEKLKAEVIEEGEIQLSGDRSGQILLAGNSTEIISAVNSQGGLLVYSNSTGVANKSVIFQFVALSKSILDPAFCAAARTTAIVNLRALGLEQSTVKGSGKLK